MFSYIIRDCNSATEHISMDTGDLEINILKPLIIHDEKTKKITTVNKVWISDPSSHEIQ